MTKTTPPSITKRIKEKNRNKKRREKVWYPVFFDNPEMRGPYNKEGSAETCGFGATKSSRSRAACCRDVLGAYSVCCSSSSTKHVD